MVVYFIGIDERFPLRVRDRIPTFAPKIGAKVRSLGDKLIATLLRTTIIESTERI